jgi:hypothetical protein
MIKLVGELRDAGIRMAMEAEGRPVNEEAWAAMEQRFKGRLSPTQWCSARLPGSRPLPRCPCG